MEKLLLTLGPKDFLTGIAPSFHTERGGLFGVANGVTPVYDPGGTASTQNGLLQAGPTPTNIGGSTVVDDIFAAVSGLATGTLRAFFLGNEGHLYQLLQNGTLSDLRSGTPITNPANGLAIWGPKGGTRLMYYWQKTQIGTWNLSGTHPTGWTDGAYTGLDSVSYHPVHEFVGNLYYGNVDTVGALTDAGSGTVAHDTGALDLPGNDAVTAISDDGVYLVVAATENGEGANAFALNKIYFWDTFSSSWQREYVIRDPFIWALKKVGGAIYAFGQYGIYQVSFAEGVKKIHDRLIGFGTTTDVIDGYGANRADVYNQSALLFATDTTIDTFGRLSADLKSAYFKHFKVPSGVGTPTCVFSRFAVGSVYVATDGAKLYRYDFNGSTRETSVSAQTIYFPFNTRANIKRIEVVFGEPLASGDAFDIDIKKDEDTSATDFGSVSFASNGAVRAYKMTSTAGHTVDSQMSLVLNWTGGAVKIKRIRVFGIPENTTN